MLIHEVTRFNYRQPHLQRSTPTQPYIFHGTTLDHLARIVKDNSLNEGAFWQKPNEPHGVRFSRRLEVAKNNFAYGRDYPFGAVIAVDWAKVSKRYGTYAYYEIGYNGQPDSWADIEDEEVVLARSVKPLSEFLGVIYTDLKAFKNPELYSEDWIGWAIEEHASFRRPADYIRLMKELSTCKFLRPFP